jgi:protein-tyrosine phosphatase
VTAARYRVLCVCLGNICRSPTAEGVLVDALARAGLGDEVEVDSAGTSAAHVGEPADARSARAARARGYELRSRARQVVRGDFERFDLIVAMDASNLRALVQLRPDRARARMALFRSFDPTAEAGAEVPDPYYGGQHGFEEVLDMCERAAKGLVEHLRSELGSGSS